MTVLHFGASMFGPVLVPSVFSQVSQTGDKGNKIRPLKLLTDHVCGYTYVHTQYSIEGR